jgi:hypothetical protein
MNLSVSERMVILQILPKEGNYATLRILQNLKLALSFTEQELKEWEIVTDAEKNQTRWSINAGLADIPIGERAMDMIVEALIKLDREKKLTEQALSVYEKFIPDK